jgi:hypothetical protein
MKMKSKLEKGGALLLAIALSGEVAAQTKTHQRSVHCKQCQRVLKVLNSGTGKPIEQLPPIEGRAVLSGLQSSVKLIYRV